jgi:hemerythrin-like domain-containing protein
MSELGKEHEYLLATGPQLAKLLQAMESSPETSAESAVEKFRAELQQFREALLRHFQREEALFSKVKRAVSKVDLATDVLATFLTGEAESDLQAHAALANQTTKMLALLKGPTPAGELEPLARQRLNEMLDATLKLLRSHAAGEDQIIFPVISHLLRRTLPQIPLFLAINQLLTKKTSKKTSNIWVLA